MDFCDAVSYPSSFILLITLNPISEPCQISPTRSAPPQGDLQPAFTSGLPVHHLCKTVVQTLQGLSRFSSVTQSCLILCYPMDCIMPGFPVHHQLLELAQTHVHLVGDDAIQLSHPLLSPSSPAFNYQSTYPSQPRAHRSHCWLMAIPIGDEIFLI